MATLLEYITQNSTYSFTPSAIFDVYQQFTATSNWTVEEVYINAISLIGARFQTELKIYGDNGSNQPNIGDQKGGSYFVNETSPGWVGGTLSAAPTLVSGTKYWIRIDNRGGNNDGANLGIDTGQGYGHPSLKWNGSSYDTLSHDFNFRLVGPDPLPSKPTNPTPSNTASDVTLDQATVIWEDGGGATSYDVYYGEDSGSLSLISAGQVGLSFTITGIDYGSPFEYITSRAWRIDAVNDAGTTTGDVWTFTSIAFGPPLPTGVTLDGSGNPTGTPTGESGMTTLRRLIAAANNKIWYEQI